ncbi:MAG: cytidylate kinase-like family protein [Prevotella sp.]|jgi:cytidylate kinase|nr:cytidylate kinase-like family protein [Prevotella sp.]
MKLNERFVITINRELGSGGRTIGEKLAQRLNVPFFDKAIVQGLKEKYELTTEEIERLKGQKHNWWADFKRSLKIMPSYAAPQIISSKDAIPDFLITDDIFQTETEILKGIADDESCVIAGRSGFFVFRDHPNHLSILIQASLEYRISRLVEKRGISREEAQSIIKEVDTGRENYVKKYTGTSRYDTRNYDIVLNADEHTEEEIVELILQYIKKA